MPEPTPIIDARHAAVKHQPGGPTFGPAFGAAFARAPEIDGTAARAPAPTDKPTPSGNTDNDLLMHGTRRLIERDAAEAVGLYVNILVRCRGKGYCWPRVDTLMADLGAPRRSVARWRTKLVDAGLIRIQRRRSRSSLIRLVSGVTLEVHRPCPELSTSKSGCATCGTNQIGMCRRWHIGMCRRWHNRRNQGNLY